MATATLSDHSLPQDKLNLNFSIIRYIKKERHDQGLGETLFSPPATAHSIVVECHAFGMNPMRAKSFPPTRLPGNRTHTRRSSLRGQGQHLSPTLDDAHLVREILVVGVDPGLRVTGEKQDVSPREIRVWGCFFVRLRN